MTIAKVVILEVYMILRIIKLKERLKLLKNGMISLVTMRGEIRILN